MRQLVSLLWIFCLASCSTNTTRTENPDRQKITSGKGTWQNPDSFAKPLIVPAGPPIVRPAGQPDLVSDQNPQPASGQPSIVAAGNPHPRTPGKNSFGKPNSFPAIAKAIPVGLPETIAAKDPVTQDQNPGNFSSYKILQGLKSNGIRCVLQDDFNNLWLGTANAGITRYDGKYFSHFTEQQGLLNNVVMSAMKDRKGTLWFGTKTGICYYDGKNFTHLTDKEGLSNKMVLSMLQDKNGNLWFGTYQAGVLRYDGNIFTAFTDKDGLAGNEVSFMLQDKEGSLWFGTESGVSRYDGTSFYNFTQQEGLINDVVLTGLQDQRGDLWFGTYGGISRYDGRSFTNYSEEQGLVNNTVMHMLQDKQGNYWLGTYGGGVSRFDGKTFTNFTVKQGLVHNRVWRLFQDNVGGLWLGTAGGLSRYDGQRFINFKEPGNLTTDISTLLQDTKGNLWLSTFGNGISRYDGKNFAHFTKKQGLPENEVLKMIKDRQGNIWFATFAGVSRYDGKTFSTFTKAQGLGNNYVTCMLQDMAGRFWFGTEGGGVTCYDGKNFTTFTRQQGLADDEIMNMLEDRSGNLWFVTFGNGLSRYDGKSFTNFTEKDGLLSNVVLCLLQDKSGNLWFGTEIGVARYDGKRFVNFSEKDGLSANAVVSLLQDKEGQLWFGTKRGLSKITSSGLARLSAYLSQPPNRDSCFNPLKQGLFYNYDNTNGFLDMNCQLDAVFQDNTGQIWWGADLLTCYKPQGDKADTTAPMVQLNSVKLFGEEINWASLGAVRTDSSGHETVYGNSGKFELGNGVLLHDVKFDGITSWYSLPQHLSLPYNNNNLTFNFTGVHMQSRNHVKYQYTLQGLEDNWNIVTERNEAHYGNLPPGEYTFKVKAMNQSGVWSKPLEFAFKVRSPWWKTWWFKATIVLTMVILAWSYIRSLEIRIAEATLEIKESNRKLEESHRAIGKQKQEIEERHKEITDSINYAERIQRSFLATQEHLDQHLSDYFVFFRPKEVVSGDFYWSTTLNNGNFALVCADSTGHGVPGAIMSLLNVTSLERAVEIETEPHNILRATREIIIERLKNDGSREGGKDGMDGSLLSFDFKNNVLYCASANNPVCIIRNNQLIEIKSDRMPIGKHEHDQEPFTLHTVQLEKGDLVYVFTDGFSDQFGGPGGKKFKYKKLLELLLSMSGESMAAQNQKLTDVFNDWKGNFEQVDDVTVIGMRV